MRQEQQCKATDGTLTCGLHRGHYADESTDHSDNGRTFGNAQREHELQPLADALTIMVRGITNVRIEQTGGDLYTVVGTLGAWSILADEYGWSLTDEDGTTFASGWWFEDSDAPLPYDEDTRALYEGTCEAAAVTFGTFFASSMDMLREQLTLARGIR